MWTKQTLRNMVCVRKTSSIRQLKGFQKYCMLRSKFYYKIFIHTTHSDHTGRLLSFLLFSCSVIPFLTFLTACLFLLCVFKFRLFNEINNTGLCRADVCLLNLHFYVTFWASFVLEPLCPREKTKQNIRIKNKRQNTDFTTKISKDVTFSFLTGSHNVALVGLELAK